MSAPRYMRSFLQSQSSTLLSQHLLPLASLNNKSQECKFTTEAVHKVIAGHILNGIALRKTVVCTVYVVFELQLVSLDCSHTHTILPMHPVLYHTATYCSKLSTTHGMQNDTIACCSTHSILPPRGPWMDGGPYHVCLTRRRWINDFNVLLYRKRTK